MAPKISVLIPTYNGVRYLRECMDSVAHQTFGDFEAIVVDDGSTDGTLDLVQQYANKDKRVRLFRNSQNMGLVPNWNNAMQLARGQWLKFVFHDDTITHTCLQDLLGVAEATGAPFVFGRRDFLFDEAVQRQTVEKYEQAAARISHLFPIDGFTPSAQFCHLLLSRSDQNFIGEPVVALFKRELVDRIGAFNRHLIVFCDMEYWMRAGVNAGVAHVAKKVASFRIHGESTTAKSVRERHFRMYVLDHLIVSHEMAFHPAFAPLRIEASRLGFDLQKRLEERIAWAYGQARRQDEGAEERLREFRDIEMSYPRIREFRTRHRSWRPVKHFLDSVRSLVAGSDSVDHG